MSFLSTFSSFLNQSIKSIFQLQQDCTHTHTHTRDSHVNMWGLKTALVDVVMGKGLGRVGAVLIHGDGDLPLRRNSASHCTSGWDMSGSQWNRADPVS